VDSGDWRYAGIYWSRVSTVHRPAKIVKRNQSANSIWDIYVSDVETPLEKSGVTIGAKTILQICSAGSFASGLASGFGLLLWALTR
jgi:hypothetical protein